jgi:hypothetical protein
MTQISDELAPISFRDIHIWPQSLFRFKFELRLEGRTIPGTLIVCQPSKEFAILRLWSDRKFKPPQDQQPYSRFEDNMLVYYTSKPERSPLDTAPCRKRTKLDKLQDIFFPTLLQETKMRDIHRYLPNLPKKLEKRLRSKTGTEVTLAILHRHLKGEDLIGLMERIMRWYWSH